MSGGGGGKGGSQTQSTQIDPALTMAGRDVLDLAAAGAAMPYAPNRGVQFAAFTPQQEAAMRGANVAAEAFGLPSAGDSSGMPAAQTSASGIRGFSTGTDFDQMRDASVSTGMQAALSQLFADPETGDFSGGPGGPLFRGDYASAPQIQAARSGGK